MLACLALLTLLSAGCSSWKWAYTPNPPANRSSVFSNTIAVLPFEDARPDVDYNNKPRALIPFIIHGDAAMERWEKYASTPFTPTEDLAKALAEELSNQHFFAKALFSKDGQDTDLILHGKLLTTKVTEDMYTYGLSLVGIYLSVVGIPVVYWTCDLAFELELEEPQTKTTLWKQQYSTKREMSFRFWNTMFLSDDEGPPGWIQPMVKELMLKALKDLEASFKGMTTASVDGTRGQ